MPTFLKNFIKILCYCALFLTLIINTLLMITTRHIQTIHQNIAERLSHNLGGTYQFEHTSIEWKNFTADFYINTYNTELYDSMYATQHQHQLLSIDTLQAHVSFWSLLSQNIELKSLKIRSEEHTSELQSRENLV